MFFFIYRVARLLVRGQKGQTALLFGSRGATAGVHRCVWRHRYRGSYSAKIYDRSVSGKQKIHPEISWPLVLRTDRSTQEELCAPTPETVTGHIELALVSDGCASWATAGLQHQSATAAQAAQEISDNNYQTTETAQAILSNANSSNKNTEVEQHELEYQKSPRYHPHLRARSRSPPRSDGSRAAQAHRTRERPEAAHQSGPLAANARNAPSSAVNVPPAPAPVPSSPLNSPPAAAAEAGMVPHTPQMQKKRQPKEAPKPNSKPMPVPMVPLWTPQLQSQASYGRPGAGSGSTGQHSLLLSPRSAMLSQELGNELYVNPVLLASATTSATRRHQLPLSPEQSCGGVGTSQQRLPTSRPTPGLPSPRAAGEAWVGYPEGSPADMATVMHSLSQHVVPPLAGAIPFQYATAPMQAPMPMPAHAGLQEAAGSAQADDSSGSPAPLQQPVAKKKQCHGKCGVPSSPLLPTPAPTITPTLTPHAHRSRGLSQPLHGHCGFSGGPMSPVSTLPSPRSIGGEGGPPALSLCIQRSPCLGDSTGSNSVPMLESPHQLLLANAALQSPYVIQPAASTSTTVRGGGSGEGLQISIESHSSSGADWQQWPVLQRPSPTSTSIADPYALGSQAGPTATISAWETHNLKSEGYIAGAGTAAAAAGGVGFVGQTPPPKQHTNTFNSHNYGTHTASTSTTPHSMGGLEPRDRAIGIFGGPDPPSVALSPRQLQQPHAFVAARSPSPPLQQSQHYPSLPEHRHPHYQMQSAQQKQSQQQQQGLPMAQPRQHRLQQLPPSPLPLLANPTVHSRGAGAGSSANAFPYNHPLMPGTAAPMPTTMRSHSPKQMPMPTQIPMLGQQQQAHQPRAGDAVVVSLIAPLSLPRLDKETE